MSETDLNYDYVIVGAGPAGLATAIRLIELKPNCSIAVLDKAGDVGRHSLSGAILQPDSLDSLLPNWRKEVFSTQVTSESFEFLTKTKAYKLPIPVQMQNKKNLLVRLGDLCQHLSEVATNLGVDIFPATAVADVIVDKENQVLGVKTVPMGLNRDGIPGEQYSPSINLFAQCTIVADGAAGPISTKIISKYKLARAKPTYGLGIKEVWEIDPKKHELGKIIHTIGFPLKNNTYGGGFIYHLPQNKLAIGLIVGLDYQNPYLDPHLEMQTLKSHPTIKQILCNGTRIAYGARVINEGGYQSIAKSVFPGGILVGCSIGLVDNLKLKGIHNAIKSGMIAAESLAKSKNDKKYMCQNYENNIQKIIGAELKQVRNIRPAFKFGLIGGLIQTMLSIYTKGKEPWTFKHKNLEFYSDRNWKKPEYPKIDQKLYFDKSSSVYLTNSMHDEQQPCHIKVSAQDLSNLTNIGATNFCPANVYNIVGHKLNIQAANCIHCQTCNAKITSLTWSSPQGGDGPNYDEI